MLKLVLLASILAWLVLRQKTKDHPEKTKTIKLRRFIGYSLVISSLWIGMKAFGIPQNQIHVEGTYTINNGSTKVLFGYSENRLIPALHVPRLYSYDFNQIHKVSDRARNSLVKKHPYIKDAMIWVNQVGGLAILLLFLSWLTRSRKIDRMWANALETDKKKAYDEFEKWSCSNVLRKLHSSPLVKQSEKRRERLNVINEQKLAIITKAIMSKGRKPEILVALKKVKEAGLSSLHVFSEHIPKGDNEGLLLNYGATDPKGFDKALCEFAQKEAIANNNGDVKEESKHKIILESVSENRYGYPMNAIEIISSEIQSNIKRFVKSFLSEDYISIKEGSITDLYDQQAVLHIQYKCTLDSNSFKDITTQEYPVGYKSSTQKSTLTKEFNGKKIPRTPYIAIYYGMIAEWRLVICGQELMNGTMKSLPDRNISNYALPRFDRFEAETPDIAHEKYFTTIARSNINALVLQLQGKLDTELSQASVDKTKLHQYKTKAQETKDLLKELEDALRDEIKGEVQYEAASIISKKIYEKYKDEVDALAHSIIDNDIDPEMTALILEELGELFPDMGEYFAGLGLEVISD
ncbi:hypothetical protein JCM19240_5787 [Vibrio maritimus]|uniref:Uncharacterized protein n=1 Tax=Vibrio maritimus TaxID=990268 RepID=A0A090SXC7_9VIBR|nr:hypothetical protein JCM19240_5787 [Vibrio maritimus]